jgi:inner membrane protein YidH
MPLVALKGMEDEVPEEVGGIRDQLANERTQLAWLRTGANVMVVGLAVARFAGEGSVTGAGLVAGGLLILAGAAGVIYGTHRYRRVAHELRLGTAQSAASSTGPSFAAWVLLAVIGAATIILLVA